MAMQGVHAKLKKRLFDGKNESNILCAILQLYGTPGDDLYKLLQIGCEVCTMDSENPFRSKRTASDFIAAEYRERGLNASVITEEGAMFFGEYGVIDQLRIDLDLLVRTQKSCLPAFAFPFVDKLVLQGEGTHFDELPNLEIIQQFRDIWFGEPLINDQRLAKLLHSPHFVNVERWSFRDWGDTDDKNLREEYGGVITADGARMFSSSPVMSRCRYLDIGYNRIGIEGISSMAASSYLNKLETFVCWDSDFGDNGIEVISAASGFDSLRHVGCGYNSLTHDGVKSMFKGRIGQQLLSLAFHCSNCDDKNLFPIDETDNAPLEHLHMNYCSIRSAAFGKFLESAGFPALKSLSVRGNPLGDGVSAFSKQSKSIRNLDLGDTEVGRDAVKDMFLGDSMTSLVHLDLSDNDLGDGDVLVLSNAPCLRNLRTLLLNGTKVTMDGLHNILRSKTLSNLSHLGVDKRLVDDKYIINIFEQRGIKVLSL